MHEATASDTLRIHIRYVCCVHVQTAYQLVSPLVPQSTIAQIVRDSVILELSPTVVCIVLAGVVGSKIASELGNMRTTEQIDALEIMGINTRSYLIMPKILGALIVVPFLVVISAVLAIWGGRTAGAMSGILAPEIFDPGAGEAPEYPGNGEVAKCQAEEEGDGLPVELHAAIPQRQRFECPYYEE